MRIAEMRFAEFFDCGSTIEIVDRGSRVRIADRDRRLHLSPATGDEQFESNQSSIDNKKFGSPPSRIRTEGDSLFAPQRDRRIDSARLRAGI